MKGNFYLRYVKRPFDFLLALLGLFFLSPLIVGLSVWVYLKEGAPVFFLQERVGQYGRLFKVVKFRTMSLSNDTNPITVSNDSRITPLGAFLRRYKLDELPQLLNVLKGEMSFVGPRPDVPGYADKLEGEERAILFLRPGITGPATLAFRNEEELLSKVSDPKRYNNEVIFPRKVQLNLQYLRQVSLFYDLKIIFATVFNRRWE